MLPADASTHVQHIHRELYASIGHLPPHCHAGYCGPWIENHWIDAHRPLLSAANLTAHFGPYIPLLIPWVDLWVRSNWAYPAPFVALLRRLLRPTVQYITVSQNDEGIAGRCEFPHMSNVLVLSAGGFGHVPIPLLSRPLQPPAAPTPTCFSFLGSVQTSGVRHKMCAAVTAFAQQHHVPADLCVKHADWQARTAGAAVGLCPRGFGRTSFRLAETLQLGTVPWYVYDDEEWLPYRNLYPTIGFSSHIRNLSSALDATWPTFHRLVKAKTASIPKYMQSHFTYAGVIKQIQLFMTNPAQSDLVTQAHPRCPRSARCDCPVPP